MNELHLFAGAGGGILAGQLRGNRCVCVVEREPYAQAVLVARQDDGTFPPFPIWDDVRTFDGRPWRGIADVVCGGFPCQDISVAGGGDGLDGERSGLWAEMARIIREVQPCRVEVENSPMLTSRGLGRVLGDLAAMGFDAEWGVVSAADAGAPHLRERIWIVAYANGLRELQQAGGECDERDGLGDSGEDVADAVREREQRIVSRITDPQDRKAPASLTRKTGKSRAKDRIDHAVMASDGGQLNPEWVEWLMGWPIGHTGLKPLATGRYREWLQQHSPFCLSVDEVAA